MISVEQLIGDLLLRHNCVIVPSFGGFVANQTSAVIDYASGVMLPPKKSLMFNRQLVNNDGLLISELSQANQTSYQEAQSIVLSTAQNWTDALKRGERVSLEKIGHLYFDQEKNICFEQDRFFNLLLQSYGLGKVHFVSEEEVRSSIQVEKEELLAEAPIRAIDFNHVDAVSSDEDQKVIAHPAIRKRTKVWRYVAAACILPIAFYSYWIPMKTDVLESGMLSVKDFNPFYHSQEGDYHRSEIKLTQLPTDDKTLEEMIEDLPSYVEVFSYPLNDDTYIILKVDREQEVQNDNQNSEDTDQNQAISGGLQYIVGCFGSETNATNLVSKLKANGMNASIAGTANGLIRVSAGSAFSEEAIQQIASKAQSLGYPGWVLKK
jgi:hypothetical protein